MKFNGASLNTNDKTYFSTFNTNTNNDNDNDNDNDDDDAKNDYDIHFDSGLPRSRSISFWETRAPMPGRPPVITYRIIITITITITNNNNKGLNAREASSYHLQCVSVLDQR